MYVPDGAIELAHFYCISLNAHIAGKEERIRNVEHLGETNILVWMRSISQKLEAHSKVEIHKGVG